MSHVDIQSMTPTERLALMGELWDSLAPEDVPVTDAERAELDRRLDEMEHSGEPGVDVLEALRGIRERLR